MIIKDASNKASDETVSINGDKGSVPSIINDWSRLLVDKSPDIICLCRNGAIDYLNPEGRRILGIKPADEVCGRAFLDFVHSDYKDAMDFLLGGEDLDSELIYLNLIDVDGRCIQTELRVNPCGDPGEKTVIIQARNISLRIRTAENLRNREERLRGIMNSVAEGIVTFDKAGVIQSFNPAAESIFGHTSSNIIGQHTNMLFSVRSEGDASRLSSLLYVADGNSRMTVHESNGLRQSGAIFPLEYCITEFGHGAEQLFTGLFRDITERKNNEELLQRSNEELEQRVEERTRELRLQFSERQKAEKELRLADKIIETLSQGVLTLDRDFKVISVNPAFCEISGFDSVDLIGKVTPFYTAISNDAELHVDMWKAIHETGRWDGEFWDNRKDGVRFAERLSITSVRDDSGRVQHYAAIISDITQRKADEDRIRYQANYDTLTGLPNRALFLDRLGQSLAHSRRTDTKLALMFIDLDGFKAINDTFGHDDGDILLKEMALRLETCVRKGDTAARLGGDEFTIIMPDLKDSRFVVILAQRVLLALAESVTISGQEVFISGSIGVTVFPDDATDSSDLLRNADAAMYQAKESGKNNYKFFTEQLNKDAQRRHALKAGLKRAVEENQFQLHYQPMLDLKSKTVTGVEGLLRWNSAELGSVPPDQFIPTLEETGMIIEVGEWILREACHQQVQWHEMGYKNLRVAVNLSVRQLCEPGFLKLVSDIIDQSGVSASMLEFEITESMLMSDSENMINILGGLRETGINLAMDDFGTGYSSLSYLRRFPLDTIKIDRSFIPDIASNHDDAEIIRTIISMAKALNRRVVAEGVETEEQLSILRDYQCDVIQGYLFCRPLHPDDLNEFFSQSSMAIAADN